MHDFLGSVVSAHDGISPGRPICDVAKFVSDKLSEQGHHTHRSVSLKLIHEYESLAMLHLQPDIGMHEVIAQLESHAFPANGARAPMKVVRRFAHVE